MWYAVGGMEPGRARPMRGWSVKVSQSLSKAPCGRLILPAVPTTMVMVGVECFLPGPLDTAASAIREKTMDRDMFPRTTVTL